MRYNSFFLLFAFSVASALAAEPSGYYNSCENKCGADLLTALNAKISAHTTISYNALWDLYLTTDVKSNGKIWDMYSTKEWNSSEKCGNYTYVGDCYNREHSFPKSWFDDASPMVSDAFHIYPTDGKVNGQRSNYPFGECAGGTTLPSHGSVRALGRLGKSTFSGYSGTVFEPDDEYKGDFARSYFYMIACYNEKISSWSSDMLAGNRYPGLSAWAVNLLLKWHRQDPVSDKETKRNEAVYARQKNRNPFIDHPDLAEHIWGTEKSAPWTSAGTAKPSIALPVSGSTLDFGYTAQDRTVSRYITVKGQNISQAVTVTTSGAAFSCGATSLSASEVNSASGVTLVVSFTPASSGLNSGSLTLRSGEAVSTVTLKGQCVDGIPVSDPSEISSESFSFTWVNVDAASDLYTVNVCLAGTPVSGYPRQVSASAQSHTVENLMPETTYTYQVKSQSMSSQVKSVTTGALVPMIAFLYDGELYFTAEPGTPSEAAEVMMETDNIGGDISLSVTTPFELSTDKASWATSLTLTPDEDRFYLRVFSAESGEFHTTLKATSGEYLNDDVEIAALVSSTPDFEESFEVDQETSGYFSGGLEGTACNWVAEKVYFNSSAGEAHGGQHSIRFNKSGASHISMASDKAHGVGEVKFFAKAWSSSETGDITLKASTDGGISWTDVRKFTVTSPSYQEYKASANLSGNVRLRFDRTSGGRLCLDDISVSNFTGPASVSELEYHRWDAFSRDGSLVITAADGAAVTAAVYGTDGVTYFTGAIGSMKEIPLHPGLYIVVVDDYARRVVVR